MNRKDYSYIDWDELKEYYKTHSTNQLRLNYKICKSKNDLLEFLREHGVVPHSKEEDHKFALEISKNTCMEHWGVESPLQTKQARDARKSPEVLADVNLKISKSLSNRSTEAKRLSIEKGKKTRLEKYGDENYCNSEKIFQTKLEKYGNGDYHNTEKFKETMSLKSEEELNKINEKRSNSMINGGYAKGVATKIERGNANSSVAENTVYDYLITKFDKSDIIQQYKSKRYPHHCDFYIKSLDLFIELNCYWTHGPHLYTGSDEDNEIISRWQKLYDKRGGGNYLNAINIFTIKDPEKYRCLQKLNHIWAYSVDDCINQLNSLLN